MRAAARRASGKSLTNSARGTGMPASAKSRLASYSGITPAGSRSPARHDRGAGGRCGLRRPQPGEPRQRAQRPLGRAEERYAQAAQLGDDLGRDLAILAQHGEHHRLARPEILQRRDDRRHLALAVGLAAQHHGEHQAAVALVVEQRLYGLAIEIGIDQRLGGDVERVGRQDEIGRDRPQHGFGGGRRLRQIEVGALAEIEDHRLEGTGIGDHRGAAARRRSPADHELAEIDQFLQRSRPPRRPHASPRCA